jgi:hypothetical protein
MVRASADGSPTFMSGRETSPAGPVRSPRTEMRARRCSLRASRRRCWRLPARHEAAPRPERPRHCGGLVQAGSSAGVRQDDKVQARAVRLPAKSRFPKRRRGASASGPRPRAGTELRSLCLFRPFPAGRAKAPGNGRLRDGASGPELAAPLPLEAWDRANLGGAVSCESFRRRAVPGARPPAPGISASYATLPLGSQPSSRPRSRLPCG